MVFFISMFAPIMIRKLIVATYMIEISLNAMLIDKIIDAMITMSISVPVSFRFMYFG